LLDFYDDVIVVLIIIICLVRIRLYAIFLNRINYRNFTENNFIEFIWTICPALILIFIAIPSLQTLYILEDIFKVNLVIKSVGYQWYWSYEYRNFLNLEFDSYLTESKFRLLDTDNSLVVPLNSYICIVVTGSDVIHSWRIPSLGLKTDAIPGRLNQIIFLARRCGIFFGQCSEICGVNHRFIPIKLEVVPLKYFFNWVDFLG